MERKDYILTNVTQLLNQQGAATTSLRQIAAYLDMSDGNLRYHFSTKEALLTAIFQQMLEEVKEVFLSLGIGSHKQPEALRNQLRSLFFTMWRYKFLFLESSLLISQYPSFRKAFLQHMALRKKYFAHFIQEYQKKNAGSSKPGQEADTLLQEQLFILSDNWIKYVALEESGATASIDARIDHYADLCLHAIKINVNQANDH